MNCDVYQHNNLIIKSFPSIKYKKLINNQSPIFIYQDENISYINIIDYNYNVMNLMLLINETFIIEQHYKQDNISPYHEDILYI